MKHIFLIISLWSLYNLAFAQYQQATMHEDFTISVEEIDAPLTAYPRSTFNQLAGYPKAFVAHPNHKNVRNVTLADLNGDGIQEVIFAANGTLYAYANNVLLWSKTLSGVGLYPPSVADIDGDGQPEIVLGTGGTQAPCRLYALDRNGNDLTGFPVSLNNNWVLTAPTLVDLDNDGQREIIVTELAGPVGNVHVLKSNGTPYNNNWPVALTNRPATTASVGDIDNDGEKDIIIHSTRTLYAFNQNGQDKAGFPVVNPDTWFSFQSAILMDLDEDGTLEIIGASHGDAPEYYVINHDGTYRNGWPKAVPQNEWTFSTPSILNQNGDYQILMSRRTLAGEGDMLYNWDKDGVMQNGFPIVKDGGCEGTMSIADVDADGQSEIIFGSNMIDAASGNGFIHAYEMDGSGEVSGFPVQPRGWTLMNGAVIGDINGDQTMDMVVLSYTQFGAAADSIYINAYDLGISYAESAVQRTGYKGSNSREGLLLSSFPVNVDNYVDNHDKIVINITPNPVIRDLKLEIDIVENSTLSIDIHDILGQKVGKTLQKDFSKGKNSLSIATENLETGVYLLTITNEDKQWLMTQKFIKKGL